MILSLLIFCSQQPSNNINVYLTLLIEDLQNLWEVVVKVYDAYEYEFLNLRAMLIWTISDFPAYENLMSCTVKRYNTCPYYRVDNTKCRPKHSGKNAYIGLHCWLPHGHEF